MLDKRVITGISIFIIAGLIIFSFANPAQEEPNPSDNNKTQDVTPTPTPNPSDTDTTTPTDGTDGTIPTPTNGAGGTGATTPTNTTPSTTATDPLAQAISNATNAVIQAENSLSQQDVTTARDLVNALPNGSTKDALNDRLDAVQAIIDLNNAIENAITAVETAEDSLLQGDVDAARDLVNALPDGSIKDTLNDRLDAVQAIIDLNNEIENAATAVETAETTLLQIDVNTARDLVNALPDGPIKDSLNERLDNVQTIIDLNNAKADAIAELNAYVNAKDETMYSTANWDIILGYRNSGIDNINAATTTVEITGALNDAKANIDSVKTIAQEQADALAAAKTAAILELTNYKNDPVLYNPGMWTKVEEYRTDGFNAINTATTVADVTTVLNIAKANIDSVKTLAEEFAIALSAVETAEASLLQSDVDAARDLVNVLPGGPAKETLNTRLDAVQAIIDLNNAKANAIAELNAYVIAKDETLYSTANWDIVLGYRNSGIDSINAATTITGITNALNDAKANIDSVKTIAQEEADALAAATQAVEKAETSLLQSDMDAAWDLVNALPNSIEKTNLINRLNATQAIIDLEQAIQAATEAVEKAEASLLQSDINAAWLLVTPLPDGIIKTDLTNRLNDLQAMIDLDGIKQAAIDYLNSFVSVMDSNLYSTTNWNMILEYLNNGIAAIESATTESSVHDILNNTLYSISSVATIAQEQAYQALITDALNKLAIVERTFDNDDFSAASNAVNLLKASELKTSLLIRINQLQTIFNNHHENKFSSAVKALETAEKSKDPKEIAAVQKKINDLETLNSDYTSYYVVLQLKARLVLLLGR